MYNFLYHSKTLQCPHSVFTEVKQSLYRPVTGPEGSRRMRLLDFETVGYAPAAFTPKELFLVLIFVRS
jgi:hypothetical protein